jgi:hypothetical protein
MTMTIIIIIIIIIIPQLLIQNHTMAKLIIIKISSSMFGMLKFARFEFLMTVTNQFTVL